MEEGKSSTEERSGQAPSGKGGSKRRQCLSQSEVRAIFSCIRNGGTPPSDFRIIVVPKFGDNNAGLRLSPPPYEYEEGVYVFLRLNVAIPAVLSDRVLLHRDLALLSDRSWSLSGPQYSLEDVDIQQRYCTPKGKKDDYRGVTKGALWTLVNSGEEDYDMRVFHVYRSSGRRHSPDSPAKKAAETVPSAGILKTKRAKKPPARPSAAKPQAKMPVPKAPHVSFSLSIDPGTDLSSFAPSDALALVSKPAKRQRKPPATAGVSTAQPPSKAKPRPTIALSKKERQTTRSWTSAEDDQLNELVGTTPEIARVAWNQLARQMGTNRSGKQCRERYMNHLKPDRKKGNWTPEEDCAILRLQTELGNQWSRIAAELPGRSDNDVKNRWHSRMRSQKRMRARSANDMLGEQTLAKRRPPPFAEGTLRVAAVKRSRKMPTAAVASVGPDVQLSTTKPIVGQRVQAQFEGGKWHSGTITKVAKDPKNPGREKITILFYDGSTQGAFFPDKDIRLLPTKNDLTENEVSLCHELVNLHTALKNTEVGAAGSANKAETRVNEEESCAKAMMKDQISQEDSEVSRGNAGDDSKPAAKGSSADSDTADAKLTAESCTKPAANGGDAKVSSKAEEQSAPPKPKVPKSNLAAATAATDSQEAAAVNAKGDKTPAMSLSSGPSALSFQAPATQPAPVPFTLLQGPQQQQLVAAAQLLSSVNPGLAMAAIASAQQTSVPHMSNMSMPNQGQNMAVLLNNIQQLNNAFQTGQFNNFQNPRNANNNNGEAMAAMFRALTGASSKATQNQAPAPSLSLEDRVSGIAP